MGTTRKYYTDQFKEEALKLAESVGLSQTAKDLGIHISSICRWKSQTHKNSCSNSSLSEKDKEILKLKKELRYVYEVNEVLKKSLGIIVENPRKNFL